ncbi:hypothetical protein ABL78_0803 [Leptomonas seymouri]|uniref:Uncharacterized protein n=1 Tax=Leptomonas seymouri TaxID=5684 RepID=A0A0N1I889_LEPSE|nr:hypothetical protein ABL78_0803 [Leptomonas seymouri]|eukprot:KPI90050.1 hypothetical protein ABL78_0803 [Leptomonas seymouri]
MDRAAKLRTPPADAPTACELPSDSELLDQWDIDAELANFLRDPVLTGSTIASVPTAPFSSTDAQRKGSPLHTATPPRSCLIGGPLFEPRSVSPSSLSRLHGRHGWPAVPILASAVFCPFTLQFFSLYSPHWGHIYSAGFGLSPGRHGARCVKLRDIASLRRCARLLQACDSADTRERTDKGAQASALPTRVSTGACVRREQLLESWRWSPSLQRTLGAMLCAAPLNSLDALRAAVEKELQAEQNYNAVRVICIETEGASEDKTEDNSPWRRRWTELQCPILTGAGGASSLLEKGIACASLQWADKLCTKTSSSWSVAIGVEQRLPCASSLSSTSLLPDWASDRTERRCLPLLGLPVGVRAAFLEIPFSTEADAPAWMLPVCAEVLARLSRDLATAAQEVLGSALPRLYYCPLAHGVDYNGVLDLRAFRMPVRGDSTSKVMTHALLDVLSGMCANVAETIPVLSLGMGNLAGAHDSADDTATATPLSVAVFDNAHLLSKRAISRLLEQWTRNGSAARRHREFRAAQGCNQRQSYTDDGETVAKCTAADTSSPSQTRMGSQVPAGTVLPHLRTLAVPFGDVQAVFLSYRPQEEDGAFCAAGLPAVLYGAPGQSGPEPISLDNCAFSVSVCPVPRADLLYVEESLATTLLRVSALYRLHLTAPQRQELLESIVQCIRRSAGGDVPCVRRVQRQLPCCKTVVETIQFPLDTSRGQALLCEACEAVLALLLPLDAVLEGTNNVHLNQADEIVRVLTLYPTLSTLRLRHVLLSAYRLQVAQAATRADSAVAGASAEAQKSDTAASSPQSAAKRLRVRFLVSRQDAYARAAQEQQRLLNQARIRAETVTATKTPSSLPSSIAPPCLLSQAYSLYAEPPLLLGRWWTATLLFCAPTLADVVSLRCFLLDHLRSRHCAVSYCTSGHLHSAVLAMQRKDDTVPEAEDFGGDSRGHSRIDVEDVDIIATDLRAGMQGRNRHYRVYGVRALARFTAPTTAEPHRGGATRRIAAMASALKELEKRLQCCLKGCAATGVFFPMWAYRGAGCADAPAPSAEGTGADAATFSNTSAITVQGAPQSTCRDSDVRGASGGSGGGQGDLVAFYPFFANATRRLFSHPSFSYFNTVMEWRTLWIPARVERRLFTLAVAQKPSVVLTVGALVALQEAVHVPCKIGDGEGRRTYPITKSYPRSCVCQVVGFVTIEQLFAAGTVSRPPALPPTVQRQVEGWTSAERLQVLRYVKHQRSTSALPLLTCVWDAVEEGEDVRQGRNDDAFVLVPRPSFVGGYRSTHYYGLPVLHLPVCVLTGDLHHQRQTPKRREPHRAHCTEGSALLPSPLPTAVSRLNAATAPLLLSTSPEISLDFVLTDAFHPYRAAPSSSMSALCLTHAERATALRLLFGQMAQRGAAHSHPCGAAGTPTGGTAPTEDQPTHSLLSFMEDVLFYDAKEVSPQSSMNSASATAAASTEAVRCTLLTELALYAR